MQLIASRVAGPHALAIASCTLWASAFAAVKVGLLYAPPLQFAGIRFMLAGLIILPLIGGLGAQLRALRGRWGTIALVGVVQTFLQYGLFYRGMELVPGALGAMVVGSGPLFVALMAHLLLPNDRITRRSLAGIGIGIAGIVLLTLGRERLGATGPLALLGIGLLLANNLVTGIGNVLVARDGQRISPLLMSSLSMALGGLMLFSLGVGTEGLHPIPGHPAFWLSLGWLSLLSAAAVSIWYMLLKRPGVKVSELNMWKFIIPVLGALLSWAILPNEYPTGLALVGMALIGLSLLVTFGRGKPQAR